jgi:hypothetical protein
LSRCGDRHSRFELCRQSYASRERRPPFARCYSPIAVASELDACERIAGFPLVKVQKALTWVRIIGDRDDVKSDCDALGCSPRRSVNVHAHRHSGTRLARPRAALVVEPPRELDWRAERRTPTRAADGLHGG